MSFAVHNSNSIDKYNTHFFKKIYQILNIFLYIIQILYIFNII